MTVDEGAHEIILKNTAFKLPNSSLRIGHRQETEPTKGTIMQTVEGVQEACEEKMYL
jgi:hypothetical protein